MSGARDAGRARYRTACWRGWWSRPSPRSSPSDSPPRRSAAPSLLFCRARFISALFLSLPHLKDPAARSVGGKGAASESARGAPPGAGYHHLAHRRHDQDRSASRSRGGVRAVRAADRLWPNEPMLVINRWTGLTRPAHVFSGHVCAAAP